MKIAIIGVGLIGGSLAKNLKKNNFASNIIGYGRNAKNLELAVKNKVIDDYTLDLKTAVDGADIIVLATPVSSFKTILEQIKPFVKNQILTDVGSTKQSVIFDVKAILGNVDFIPAHPIAGKEVSGGINADENLFLGKKLIITPYQNKQKSFEIIRKMWSATGAIVEEMTAQKHDDIFALTSHLPHILAFGLVGYMDKNKASENYTGGGFKDFSRIASSDSQMWADICENNKIEILKHLKNYQIELSKIAQLIEKDAKDDYQNYFVNAKNNRDKWLNNK